MAQPNSVQREPSMEEILASIRRIIEDSDTAKPLAENPVNAELQAAQPAGGNVLDVDAFRASLREGFDIDHARDTDNAPADDGVQSELRPTHGPEAVLDVVSEHDHHLELPGFADMLDQELQRAPGILMAEDHTTRPAIISDRTQRQVAASFGELSEAFAATRQKSFDEIAEDMIRPMLQDWLDNNLPTMVERLVREEIERIARGPSN